MGLFGRRRREVSLGQPAPEPDCTAATDLFKLLIKERWAPVLRECGLKGSGRIFMLPNDLDWAMLGFQSSSSSSADCVKFTMNMFVAGKVEYAEARNRASYLSERPSPNVMGGPHRYSERVGRLVHGEDYWWRIHTGQDIESVASEISEILTGIVVPKLQEEVADRTPGPRGTFANVRRKP